MHHETLGSILLLNSFVVGLNTLFSLAIVWRWVFQKSDEVVYYAGVTMPDLGRVTGLMSKKRRIALAIAMTVLFSVCLAGMILLRICAISN
jgi:hypothetical protein